MKKIYSVFSIIFLFIFFVGNVNAQCTAGYTFVVNPANNGEVTFTNTSLTGSTGGPIHYYWSSNYDLASSDTSPVHVFNGIGTYYVCLEVYDSLSLVDSMAGCTSYFCDSVTVINDSATCTADFYHFGDTASTVYLSNHSNGTITNYFWDFGDGATSTLANPGIHTYAAPGIYNICLTTTNPATLCNSTYCDTTFFTTCHSDFSFVVDASGTGCTFTSIGSGTPNTYLWDFGDGTTSTLSNPYHVFPTNSNYGVCLTVSSTIDSACRSINCYAVTIGNCYSHFYVTQDSSNFYNYFTNTNSYSLTPGSTLTYLWDFGDGTTSTLMIPPHVYPGFGPYFLCLTIDDGMGCTSYYCDSIYPGLAPGSVLTLNMTSAGIHQIEVIHSFETYPNPFSNATTISYSLTQNTNIEIGVYDLLGNKLLNLESGNKTAGEHQFYWDSQNISAGIYFLVLKTDYSKSVKKIVITK